MSLPEYLGVMAFVVYLLAIRQYDLARSAKRSFEGGGVVSKQRAQDLNDDFNHLLGLAIGLGVAAIAVAVVDALV